MHAVLNFVQKEFYQLRRDSVRLRIFLVAPILQLILLGYAVNLDVREIPTVVHDQDRTATSRALVDRFAGSGYFTIEHYAERSAAVDAALAKGDVVFALVIPQGFAADLAGGRTARLQSLVDGTDAAFSARAMNYAAMITRAFSRDVLLERFDRLGAAPVAAAGVDAEVRVWFNPELRSRWFLIPGILALVLMVLTIVGTAVGVVREKEIGTMEQLIVTPLRPYQMVLGKLIPNAVVGLVAITLVLLPMRFVFGVPIRGSLVLLFALCLLFLLTTLGIGLFISTISQTQGQAMMSAVFFAILPMVMLSGFVFPIENMPVVIQAITYLLPLRYFFTIVRALLLKGVGLEVLWDETLALAAFGVGILVLAALRFQKRLG